MSEIEKIERSERRVLMALLSLGCVLVLALAGIATVSLLILVEHLKYAQGASETLSLAQVLANLGFGGLVASLIGLLNWLWKRSLDLISARDARARLKAYVYLCERGELLKFLHPEERKPRSRKANESSATTAGNSAADLMS